MIAVNGEIPEALRPVVTEFSDAVDAAEAVGVESRDAWRMLTDGRHNAVLALLAPIAVALVPDAWPTEEAVHLHVEGTAFAQAAAQLRKLTADLAPDDEIRGEES